MIWELPTTATSSSHRRLGAVLVCQDCPATTTMERNWLLPKGCKLAQAGDNGPPVAESWDSDE